MPILKIKDLKTKEILPGFIAQMTSLESMLFSQWTVSKGSTLPAHHHIHEQISILIEGKFEFTLAGKTEIIEPGMVVLIPSDAVHSGRALEDCVIIDIFSPIRQDYVALMNEVED